jgi:CheY-like chemotaxis protein
VAKILVADDNSNIQKMVGLALKDHGIEVVAVGNGEAAVRKISDIRPDLVLADVFMPVRNGYEVCQYVKQDSALSHIPVILLVGAFDPLDEQEAQRVGADGVLKKPFVPPDPLISMVKSALVRAGVAHSGFTPASEEVSKESTPEAPARVPTFMALPKAELPTVEAASLVEEVLARPAALKLESGSQPLAFGSLLSTPNTETHEDLGNAPVVPPELAQERDWRALDAQDQEEEEDPEASKSSWRRDAGEEAFTEEIARSARDWRNEGPSARSSAEEAWTPTREKQDLTEAAETPDRVSAAVTERKSTSPAAPFAGDAWAAAIGVLSRDKTAVAEAEREPAPTQPATPAAIEESAVAEPERAPEPSSSIGTAPSAVEPERPSTAGSWFSTPPSPWEAEALKASQLASTWDNPAAPPVEAHTHGEMPAATSYEPTSAPDEIEVVSEAAVSAIPAAAVETLREETSQVVEQVAHEAVGNNASTSTTDTSQEVAARLDIDAVVARVFARMSPDVLQDVTREILKPVIEAIVRDELKKL